MRISGIGIVIILALFSLIFPGVMQAFEPVGSFEDVLTFQTPVDTLWWVNSSRLRLDIDVDLGESAGFIGDFVFQAFAGKCDIPLLDFLPPSVEASLDATFRENLVLYLGDENSALLDTLAEDAAVFRRTLFRAYLTNSVYLDNAYLSLNTGKLNMRVGYQQIGWGVGYAWNPTDLFHHKETLDPTRKPPGVPAFRGSFSLGSSGSLTAIVSPEEIPEWSTGVIKAQLRTKAFDAALSFGTRMRSSTPWDSFINPELVVDSTSIPGDTLLVPEYPNLSFRYLPYAPYFEVMGSRSRESMVAFESVGEILGLGCWVEAGKFFEDPVNQDLVDHIRFLAGMDYTVRVLPWKDAAATYFIVEYLHDGEGSGCPQVKDWLTYISGEKYTLGRNYIFSGIAHPVTDLSTLRINSVINLDDESVVVIPRIENSMSNDLDLVLNMFLFSGKNDSEFGHNKFSASIGITGYF